MYLFTLSICLYFVCDFIYDNPSVLRSLANDAKAKASAKASAMQGQSNSKTINSILNASHSGVTITPTSSSPASSINR